MKFLILVFVCVLLVVACEARKSPRRNVARYELAFQRFINKYHKQYSNAADREHRFRIFKKNLDFIDEHNAKGLSYRTGVNQFADLTSKEFVSAMNGYKHQPNKVQNVNVRYEKPLLTGVSCPNNAANSSTYTCDWRLAGVVTGVKNQGQCGSCWAFSAIASTEGQHALATKNLVSLSEQNLVDCSSAQGNEGCNGGLMDNAFKYIISNKGIDTEASYPYLGVDSTCRFNRSNVGATLVSYQDIPTGNETALTLAIQNVGPISVAIDASHQSFQFYTSGVYYDLFCSSTKLDHGVTAVGYGQLSGKQFYLVKNSWSSDWGMEGYILMSRDRHNNCGIATAASYPIAQ